MQPNLRRRYSARTLHAWRAAGLPELFALRAAAAGTTELLLYDEIGFWGVTAQQFVAALADIAGPLTLRINSPGGDVFDGMAIYNALRARQAPVNVVVDGLAASAASLIAMGGGNVAMAPASMLMIHQAWGVTAGNGDDHRAMAGTLDKIDGLLADAYAAKSGTPATDMLAAMTAETWYTPAEAKDAGLCDQVLDAAPDDAQAAARSAVSLRAAAAPAVPRNAATPAEWVCGADRNLPIDSESSWDGPAAAERMLDAAGFNGASPDPGKAKRGFLVWDHHNPKLKGSYKLPFADLVDGELKALKSGLDAAASRLPQTDGLSQETQDAARAVIDAYQKRMGVDGDDAGNQGAARLRLLRLAAAAA